MPDGICNPVFNVKCHIRCRDFTQNVSGGVAIQVELRFVAPIITDSATPHPSYAASLPGREAHKLHSLEPLLPAEATTLPWQALKLPNEAMELPR